MGLVAVLVSFLVLAGPTMPTHADAGVLYVVPSCTGAPSLCYTTVQAAVDAAAPGNEIRAAAGIYAGVSIRLRNDWMTTTGVVTQVVYISKTLTIRGGYTATNTILEPHDGNQCHNR